MLRAIPVRLGPRRVNQDGEFVDRPPLIDVCVSCEASWSTATARLPQHNGIMYPALIDTGSEATAISREIALAIGASQSSPAVLHGFSGKQQCEAVDIHIVVPSQNLVFSSRAAVTDLSSAGHTFSIVLGRSFLQHCRFTVEGPAATYQLLWIA